MAAPRILFQCFRDPRPDRVIVDVSQQSKQIGVAVAQNGFISTLEEMADGPVGFIVVHRVALVDPLKNLRQRRFTGLDEKMYVVAHEYVGIEGVMVTVLIYRKELDEFLIVRGVFEYFLFLISARDDVIKRSLKFYSRLARHDGRISEEVGTVNIAIFKSDPIGPP